MSHGSPTHRALRALALAVDAAVLLALCELGVLLWRTALLRSTPAASVALIASAGVGFVCAAPIALIVGAPRFDGRLARRSAAALAAVLAIVSGLLAARPQPTAQVETAMLLCAAATLARRAGSSLEPAGSGRIAAAVFSVLFAAGALHARPALRTYGASRGVLLGATASVIGRLARPIVRPPRATPAIVRSRTLQVSYVVLFVADGVGPEGLQRSPTLHAMMRRSVRWLDAHAGPGSTEPRWGPLHRGARVVRCSARAPGADRAADRARASVTAGCVVEAVSEPGPFALIVSIVGAFGPGASATEHARWLDELLSFTLAQAQRRAPLPSAVVAFAGRPPSHGGGAVEDPIALDPARDAALMTLAGPGIPPGSARGAVRDDELTSAVEAFAWGDSTAGSDPLLDLALRRTPWADRAVVVRRASSAQVGLVTTVFSARYALVAAPRRWSLALYDLERDPRGHVNLADLLPGVVDDLYTHAFE